MARQAARFRSVAFDGVLCAGFLQRIDDPLAFVVRLAGNLAPGGRLYLEWPRAEAMAAPRTADLAAAGVSVTTGAYHDDRTHRPAPPEADDVARVLRDSGLRIVESGVCRVPFVDQQMAIHARQRGDTVAMTLAYWSHTEWSRYLVAERGTAEPGPGPGDETAAMSSAARPARRPGRTAAGLPQPILFHYHIFKNAGTSIDQMLMESFGAAFTTFESRKLFPDLDPDALRHFLAERPQIGAVSSHMPRRFLFGPPCLPIVLLRHPIDRARSAFQFLLRDPTTKDHEVALGGFAAYVKFALDTPGEGISIRNYQTFHLTATRLEPENWRMVSTRDDLRQAQDLLAGWPCFGLVRAFARIVPAVPGLLWTAHAEAAPLRAPGQHIRRDRRERGGRH